MLEKLKAVPDVGRQGVFIMKTKYSILSTIAAVALLALTSVSQADVPTTRPGPEAARLSGAPAKVTSDLLEVRFIEINGESIQPRRFLWLEPGTYTVKVSILADVTMPRVRGAGATQDQGEAGYNVIDLELEAGKTYQIRGRYNADNAQAPYSVVLHQIEDTRPRRRPPPDRMNR